MILKINLPSLLRLATLTGKCAIDLNEKQEDPFGVFIINCHGTFVDAPEAAAVSSTSRKYGTCYMHNSAGIHDEATWSWACLTIVAKGGHRRCHKLLLKKINHIMFLWILFLSIAFDVDESWWRVMELVLCYTFSERWIVCPWHENQSVNCGEPLPGRSGVCVISILK